MTKGDLEQKTGLNKVSLVILLIGFMLILLYIGGYFSSDLLKIKITPIFTIIFLIIGLVALIRILGVSSFDTPTFWISTLVISGIVGIFIFYPALLSNPFALTHIEFVENFNSITGMSVIP